MYKKLSINKLILYTIILVSSILKMDAQLEFQKNTFKGYASLGFNVSQISNDSLGGFKKWSPNFGIGSTFFLMDNLSTSLELNYSSKGARGFVYDAITNESLYHKYIGLDYLEVPIFLSIHDRNIGSIGIGGTISTLINTSVSYDFKNVEDNYFPKYAPLEFCLLLNANIYTNKNLFIALRLVNSILPINKQLENYENQYNSVLSARVSFLF